MNEKPAAVFTVKERRRRGRRGVLVAAMLSVLALGLPSFAPNARAAGQEPVLVFAAASLKTAMSDIVAQWEARTGHAANVSYAGSSALAHQIRHGAPADVYLSANVAWMDTLAENGLIRSETRRDVLRNRLVLIAHGREAAPLQLVPGLDLAGMLGDRRLAMALVNAVPAGIYGKAALTSLGIWEEVRGNVAQADDVRAALALVARGEAPYGIVYKTDAVAEDDVSVVDTFPRESHPPIIYPAAVTSGSSHPLAAAFLDYLGSEEARPLFERQGFKVIE